MQRSRARPASRASTCRIASSVGSRQVDPDTIVRFSRWFPVGNDSVAALDVFRRVAWSFADTSNAAIPATRVERLVLRSTSGEVKDIQRDLGRPRWLFARRVSLVRGQIVVKNIAYALQRVTVLGSDVVHAGQQSFTPATAALGDLHARVLHPDDQGRGRALRLERERPRPARAAERQRSHAVAREWAGDAGVPAARQLQHHPQGRRLPLLPAARALACAGRRRTARDLSRRARRRRRSARARDRTRARRPAVPRPPSGRAPRVGRARPGPARRTEREATPDCDRPRRRVAGIRLARRRPPPPRGRPRARRARRRCSRTTTSGSPRARGAARRSTIRCSAATPATMPA